MQERQTTGACRHAAQFCNQSHLYVSPGGITRELFFRAISSRVGREAMNYNHMSGCGGVLVIRPSLGGEYPYIGSTACYENRRGVLCKVVLYAGEQPFQLGNQGVISGAIGFRLSLAGPVSFHVLGISLLPGLLAVLAQRAVQGILVQLLAVVIGAAATLAVTGTADIWCGWLRNGLNCWPQYGHVLISRSRGRTIALQLEP